VILLFLTGVVVVSARRPLSAFVLSNFRDTVLTWSGCRDSANQARWRPPGPTGLRCAAAGAWGDSALSADSFALSVDGAVYAQPHLFDGDAWLLRSPDDGKPDGSFRFEVATYDGAPFPHPLRIARDLVLPVGERFYLVEYSLVNTGSAPLTVGLLDYIVSDAPQGGQDVVGEMTSPTAFAVRVTSAARLEGDFAVPTNVTAAVVSYQVGPASGDASPLA
jgi:hypothetical protein